MTFALQIIATVAGVILFFWIGSSIPRDRIIQFFEENKDGENKLSSTRLRQLSALTVALAMSVYGTLFAFSSIDVEIIWGLLLYSGGESVAGKFKDVKNKQAKEKAPKA